MMEPNKIDDLFRRKLENEPVPAFREADWQQAKALLHGGQERKRKWFHLLWLLAILPVSLLVGWYFAPHQVQETGLDARMNQNGEVPLPADPPQESAAEMAEVKVTATPDEVKYQKPFGTERTSSNASEVSTSQDRLISLADMERSTKSFDSEKSSTGTHYNSRSTTSEVWSDDEVRRPGIIPLTALQGSVLKSLQRPERPEVLFSLVSMHQPRRSYQANGISLAAQVSAPGETVRSTGGMLGVFYHRQIFRSAYLATYPAIHFRTQQGAFAKFQQTIQYGFDSQEHTFGLEANSLQFLRLPVALGIKRGVHAIEAGLNADILLAARGSLQRLAVDGNQIRVEEGLQTGWLETSGMRKLSFSLMSSYRLDISDRLGVGLLLYYQPEDMFPGLPNESPQSATSRWSIGFQGLYYLP